MKIAVIGYSGSGKSTLARKLAEQLGLEALHLDSVFWMPGWIRRNREEMRELVGAYLDTHESWVIDRTYSRICFERRMEEADLILLLRFSALSCLRRVWKRYRTHKGGARPDMGAGCWEKLDGEFISWVLWKGRGRKNRELFRSVCETHSEKTVIIKNQRGLDAWEREWGLCLK